MMENEKEILSPSAGQDARNQLPDLLIRLSKAKNHAEEISLLMTLAGSPADGSIYEEATA